MKVLAEYLVDLLFIIGFLLVLVPTFIINIFIGCYLLGILFIIGSFIMVKQPRQDKP